MELVDYAIKRTNSFIQEIDKIRENDFPYSHSEEALELIKELIKEHVKYLNLISPKSDKTSIRQLCTTSLDALTDFLPLLGFIIRSTNVRNGFEFYGPLLRLSRQVLGNKDIRLVLSSEWDYSPLTYQEIKGLKNFILIGLPATESDNPLLVPLAGHELGHHIWANSSLSSKLKAPITIEIIRLIEERWTEFTTLHPNVIDSPTDLTTNFFAYQIWTVAVDWAIQQSTELFCDFIGVNLFGEAYLHAFAYLLAPGMSGVRSVDYPEMSTRINYLVLSAREYGVTCADSYLDLYSNVIDIDGDDTERKFWLELADQAVKSIVPELIKAADSIVRKSKISPFSEKKIEEILSRFAMIVPAQNSESLQNILIAGWRAFHNKELWKDVKKITDKDTTLKELILKTIEVFEIEHLSKL